MNDIMLVIGLMSGSSADGVDAVIARTNGDDIFDRIGTFYTPYPIEFRQRLKQLMHTFSDDWLKIEIELTQYHADCVLKLLDKTNITKEKITAIGFHGQTIFHDPKNTVTWQIGNPHLLSRLTGINVVSDFRRRDIAFGGQGAPLVPIFHKYLMRNEEGPVAVLNIGGIANITYIYGHDIFAFDTGPGNCLIDDAMLKYYDKPYDIEGQTANTGKVHNKIIEQILDEQFFIKPPPKSLDRNSFVYVQELMCTLPSEDIIATLTQLTIASIILGIKFLPKKPEITYICGGGAHNTTLIKGLQQYLNIQDTQNIGLEVDYIEALAFAYLAARFLNKLPSTFPNTTGVSMPTTAGVMFAINEPY